MPARSRRWIVIHHVLQEVGIYRAVRRILGGCFEHQIDGRIEFAPGIAEYPAPVVTLTSLEALGGALDQGIRLESPIGHHGRGQQERGDILQVEIGLRDGGRFRKLDRRGSRMREPAAGRPFGTVDCCCR